jgi:hypothetical protein
MAYILEVMIIDAGDQTIKVGHQFYGLTEREVETYKREHIGSCEYFRAAVAEDRVIETLEKVSEDELPDPDDFEEEEEEENGG